MKKNAVEWVKTTLIVLLTASALTLAWQTALFSGFINTIPFFGSVAELMRGSTGTTEASGAELKEAARPLGIVITNKVGGRHGVKYDTDARNAIYDRTSSILGEALGSASTPTEISENEWREALSSPGIYFEYYMPVRLSVLDGWVGAHKPDNAEDVLLRRICVAFSEDKSRLYYQDIERNLFFGADTASAAGKLQELEIYSENGAVFAFETGISTVRSSQYMLVLPGSEHPNIGATLSGSAEELIETVLIVLGHNEENYTTYYDNKGIFVCVGTQFNIRAYTNGRVLYRRTDELPDSGDEHAQDIDGIIERARVIATDTIGANCGDAEVFFESADYGETSLNSVSFGYYIAGGRVFLHEDNSAARIKFSSGMVTEVELIFRSFSLTGEHTTLLPERQTLAAAGREFLLSYSDTGLETLQPSWARRES